MLQLSWFLSWYHPVWSSLMRGCLLIGVVSIGAAAMFQLFSKDLPLPKPAPVVLLQEVRESGVWV